MTTQTANCANCVYSLPHEMPNADGFDLTCSLEDSGGHTVYVLGELNDTRIYMVVKPSHYCADWTAQ
jgi:hypothetical protein